MATDGLEDKRLELILRTKKLTGQVDILRTELLRVQREISAVQARQRQLVLAVSIALGVTTVWVFLMLWMTFSGWVG